MAWLYVPKGLLLPGLLAEGECKEGDRSDGGARKAPPQDGPVRNGGRICQGADWGPSMAPEVSLHVRACETRGGISGPSDEARRDHPSQGWQPAEQCRGESRTDREGGAHESSRSEETGDACLVDLRSVPGLAGLNSDCDSPSALATEPSVTWRGKHTPLDEWPRSRFRAIWMVHLSGMICEWISSLPVSPASHSHRQARVQASPIPAGCGLASSRSFATFDRPTSSWRTAPRSRNRLSPSYSGTWPAQGSMQNGMCFARPKRASRTSADGSSCLLPTPTEYGNNNRAGCSEKAGDGLATAIRKLLPTPSACEGFGRRRSDPAKRRTDGLETALRRMLPAPRNALSGAPNPEFVSWMMGLPIGWTSCAPLATQSFRQWLRRHGGSSTGG